MKQLFATQQDFIDMLFRVEPEGPLTSHFGVRFRGLDEISHTEEDDGDFAGPMFYELEASGPYFKENFPKSFPCVMWAVQYHDGHVISNVVYPSDFK